MNAAHMEGRVYGSHGGNGLTKEYRKMARKAATLMDAIEEATTGFVF